MSDFGCEYCGGCMVEQNLYFICNTCSHTEDKISKKMIEKFNDLSDEELMRLLTGRKTNE